MQQWAASAVRLHSVQFILFLHLSHSTMQVFQWWDLLGIALPPPHPPHWTTGRSEWQQAGRWRAGESQPHSSFLAKKSTKVCLFLMTFLTTLSLSQKSAESHLNVMLGENCSKSGPFYSSFVTSSVIAKLQLCSRCSKYYRCSCCERTGLSWGWIIHYFLL